MDAGTETRKAARRHGFQASQERLSAGGGRLVDIEVKPGLDGSSPKGLISRNFAEPSDGLEPSTPSLPSRDHARPSVSTFVLQIGPSP